MDETPPQFVSRGGLKLAAALEAFQLDLQGKTCADLGCSTGGFVDCMLQAGAAKVYAVDTAYGELAWKLRQDERVEVMERTNAVHADAAEPCDIVSIDLGWTKQDKAIPAALRWLKTQDQSEDARIITLIKPHYERPRDTTRRRGRQPKAPPLTDEQAEQIANQVAEDVLPGLGTRVLGLIPTPIRGGKGGNLEFLALLARA